MIFSAVITISLVIQIIIGTTQVPNRIGIVTQDKVCTDIGAQMVKIGGKSFDAFIASSLCLGVVNPFFAGFGA
jgi:gamma-glutamyltranspeptidase